MSRKRILNSFQKQRKLERQRELEKEKRLFLEINGFEGRILSKHTRLSWKRLYELILLNENEEYVYPAHEYLLVGWCNKTKDYSAREIIGYYEDRKNSFLKDEIEYYRKLEGDEGSSGKAGHVIIDVSNDEEYLKNVRIPYLEKLGYEILYFSKIHTLNSLLQCEAYCLSMSTEDLREHIYRMFRKYVKFNIPILWDYFK